MKTTLTLFILSFAFAFSMLANTGVPSSDKSVEGEKIWTILVYEFEDKVHTSVVSKELDCTAFDASESLQVVSCSHVLPKDLNSTLSRVSREYKSRLIPYSQAVRELGLE